jgi:AbrB family looped-hinge helix DNA binding protein
MSKVTSKLQVTVPKAIADQYGIRPGDEIEWIPAGETICVRPPGRQRPGLDPQARLKLFDAATARQRRRGATSPRPARAVRRGWTREDLYERARPR